MHHSCLNFIHIRMSIDLQHRLCSSAKIDRDKAYIELLQVLSNADLNKIKELQHDFFTLLSQPSNRWETQFGAISGIKALIESNNCQDVFALSILEHIVKSLDDIEVRVRLIAGELLGSLCGKLGSQVYLETKNKIYDGIRSNLNRNSRSNSPETAQSNREENFENVSPSFDQKKKTDVEQIFHDTAGWKYLESYMKCLQNVITGCGYAFSDLVDDELLDLIFCSLRHPNRFVRETGFYVCSSIALCSAIEKCEQNTDRKMADRCTVSSYGQQLSEHLGLGLADNWSQVRLAGSVSTRNFLMGLPTEEAREAFYPVLIPRMCLNRYYVAEGVRIYSQETWRLVTHGSGKNCVEKYIDSVVPYYIEATCSDNHAVREAACSCIAELGSKIDEVVVAPYVKQLLQTLLDCFNDESWPVRDAACVACGNFVLCFPDDCREQLPALYPLFFKNLEDSIASVRQGAAIALVNVVKAYGETSYSVILGKLIEGFNGLDDQPSTSVRHLSMDSSPATYGVVKSLHDNDLELHTDKQMYSCGSLAPKMGRGGGCMDHKFCKPSEPWELADGCVVLLAELCHLPALVGLLTEPIEHLERACFKHHYTHHVNLLETVCKQIPNLSKGLGKRTFKLHLDKFLEPIFYSLDCENALTSSAAGQCLSELSCFLGESILRGRVERFDSRYVKRLETCISHVSS